MSYNLFNTGIEQVWSDSDRVEKLKSEIAKANAEAETWKSHYSALDKVCEVYKEDIEKLKEKLEIATKALVEISQETRVIEGVECSTNTAIMAAEVLKELDENL